MSLHAPTRDRGEATAQLVILVPVLVLLVMLTMQIVVVMHAANVATAAAAQGAAEGARLGAETADAAAAAASVVAELGGHLERPPEVGHDGRRVSVTVEVAAPSVVPFFPTSIRRTSTEAVERFVPEGER
jgi:hypothetical protein